MRANQTAIFVDLSLEKKTDGGGDTLASRRHGLLIIPLLGLIAFAVYNQQKVVYCGQMRQYSSNCSWLRVSASPWRR